ncbi:MAG: hypothetical protein AAF215_00340 [Cyanobacteria bacterium P01_A01_bin.123]
MALTYDDVLAGPIVRRVEPGLAAVWIALRKPAQVKLKIWEGLVRGDTTQTAVVTGSAIGTRPVGAELHLALATVVMAQGDNNVRLQSDRIYTYDLILKESDTDAEQGLLALGLLEERKTNDQVTHLPLGYEPGLLPGFALPPTDIQNLNLVQGSCRKPHSAGDDAMTFIDGLFEDDDQKHYRDPLKRPHQLFLTGDQIYADEVASDYLALLNTVGNRLLSGQDNQVIERLPFEHNDAVHAIPLSTEHFPPSRRQRLIRKAAKFTSGSGSSHLLGFGEYCASYLLNWSNVLWPTDFFAQALSSRWQRVQAYKTARTDLREALNAAQLEGKSQDNAKAKLDYYAAGKLLPPAWRKIDKFLTSEDKTGDWGTEDMNGFAIQTPPDTTAGVTGTVPFPNQVPAEVQRALAKTLSPSWYVGWESQGFAANVNEDELYTDKVLAELRSVQTFYAGLPKVRRVLANVATYMTFDDHETTDDWNITQNWIAAVNGSPMGRNILRNGMLAYGLFQAWGNDPLYFESLKPNGEADNETPGTKMLKAASKLFLTGEANPRQIGPHGGLNANKRDTAIAATLNQLFNLTETPTEPAERVRWYYRVGGGGYEVFSLDTRTFRGFKTPNGPPQLITLPQLKIQIPENPEYSYGTPTDGQGITFVIAAAPVLGFPPVENILQPIVNTLDSLALGPEGLFKSAQQDYFTGAFNHDPEPWSYHEDIFEGLLVQLAEHKRVVFISGDVHYACSVKLDYWQLSAENPGDNADPPPPQHTRFIQLTSSALKNFAGDTKNVMSHSGSVSRIAQSLALPQERMVWDKAGRDHPLEPPADQGFNLLVKHKLNDNPVFIPVSALPEGTQQHYSPNSVWRLALVHDGRSDADRFQGLNGVPDFQAEGTEDKADIGFIGSVIQKHFWHAVHGPSRLITFANNVGQITVQPDAIRYAVYSQLRDLPENGKPAKARPYTTYTIPFAADDQPPPSLPDVSS